MSLNPSDVIDFFNTVLQERGYATIRPAAETPATAFDSLLDDTTASEARQEFFSHPVIGRDTDGTPVVGQTEEDMTDAINELTREAVARGQDADDLHFILGRTPVFDGPAGRMIGYAMRAAVELPRPMLQAEKIA
ncbi:MAG: hypothetical protein AB7D37_00400 [Desulfovibrio sp.]